MIQDDLVINSYTFKSRRSVEAEIKNIPTKEEIEENEEKDREIVEKLHAESMKNIDFIDNYQELAGDICVESVRNFKNVCRSLHRLMKEAEENTKIALKEATKRKQGYLKKEDEDKIVEKYRYRYWDKEAVKCKQEIIDFLRFANSELWGIFTPVNRRMAIERLLLELSKLSIAEDPIISLIIQTEHLLLKGLDGAD